MDFEFQVASARLPAELLVLADHVDGMIVSDRLAERILRGSRRNTAAEGSNPSISAPDSTESGDLSRTWSGCHGRVT
jgi:hypothetical protein